MLILAHNILVLNGEWERFREDLPKFSTEPAESRTANVRMIKMGRYCTWKSTKILTGLWGWRRLWNYIVAKPWKDLKTKIRFAKRGVARSGAFAWLIAEWLIAAVQVRVHAQAISCYVKGGCKVEGYFAQTMLNKGNCVEEKYYTCRTYWKYIEHGIQKYMHSFYKSICVSFVT